MQKLCEIDELYYQNGCEIAEHDYKCISEIAELYYEDYVENDPSKTRMPGMMGPACQFHDGCENIRLKAYGDDQFWRGQFGQVVLRSLLLWNTWDMLFYNLADLFVIHRLWLRSVSVPRHRFVAMVQLLMHFGPQSAMASIDPVVLENLEARGSFFESPMGAVGAPPEWRQQRWQWVTENAGLDQPLGNEQWQYFRTVSPQQHHPDRSTFWVVGHTDAVLTMRRIEAIWGDLIAYNGLHLRWKAIRLHHTIVGSRSVDEVDRHGIIVSDNDESQSPGLVPVYIDVREGPAEAKSDRGNAVYMPIVHTLVSFLQWMGLLPQCSTHFTCHVYVNGFPQDALILVRPGSYVLVDVTPHTLLDVTDEEAELENPEPIPKARSEESETSVESASDTSMHTPTWCGPTDVTTVYHFYRARCNDRINDELIFVDTELRTRFFPEVYDHWPELRETDWQIIDVNGAYFTDHPTELNSVVKFVYVPVDFQPMPGHVGVVILYSFMHTRSTRAYPLPSPITTERLWQWARVQAQCRAGSSWSCSAYVNGERLLEHEARILHHGDYLRMQIEETRDRGPRGELLTIGADDQAFKRAQSAIDGHDKWPMTSATPDDVMLPVPSRAPSSARQEDHADYWIAMAWSMQLAAGWVLQRHMRQYPMTRQQRHAKKVQRRKAPLRRAYVFLYLIMAGPISDALSLPARLPDAIPRAEPLARECTWKPDPFALTLLWTTFDQLPPPGNPAYLQWTETGHHMAAMLAIQLEFKLRSNKLWHQLRRATGDGTPSIPSFPQIAEIASAFDFDVARQTGPHEPIGDQVMEHRDPILPIVQEHAPIPISLFDALGPMLEPTVLQEREADNRAGARHEGEDLVRPWTNEEPPSLLHLDDLHDALTPALLQPIGTTQELRKIAIYTDGSSSRYHVDATQTTWAFAVCTSEGKDDTLKLVDWYADSLCIDPLDAQWIGATCDRIRDGEASALIWALLWLMTQPQIYTAEVHSDATSVLWAGTGQWHVGLDDPMAMRLRAVCKLVQTAWCDRELTFHHAKAHCGIAGNELADTIAVRVRDGRLWPRKPSRAYQQWFHGANPDIYHAWIYWDRTARQDEFPPGRGLTIDASVPRFPSSMPPWLKLPTVEDIDEVAILKCATYNAHTLRHAGAIQSMRLQAEREGIHLLGLQETRTPSSIVVDSSHVRLIGAAKDGQGGVELWLSTTIPIRTSKGETYLTRQDAVILHADAELLVASLNILGVRTICVVGHAPHRGHTAQEISAWWDTCRDAMGKPRKDTRYLMFLDANATLESNQPYVGDLETTIADTGGKAFLRLCHLFDLAIPSTFQGIHKGDCATTYSHLATHRGTRNDYFAVSLEVLSCCDRTWVENAIDAGHAKVDHVAVGLLMRWPAQKCKKKSRVPGYDRDKIALASEATWQEFFTGWPSIDWSTDVTTHTHIVEQFLQQKLAKHFPKDGHNRRHSCLSEETLTMISHRRRLRRLITGAKAKMEQWMMEQAWRKWMGQSTAMAKSKQLMIMLRTVTRYRSYGATSKQLQRQVRHDRDSWLQERLQLLETMPLKDVHRFLKPLRLGKRVRQIGYKPLPQVRLLDGELAQDDQAAMTRWREHFAAMEGGYQVTIQDLWDAACNKKCPVPDMPADFRALPSIYELEHFFKQSKPGKARGHDELPGELLRHGAHRLAGCLWPLLTKLGVWCAEPLQWKGGKLAMAYKQKGQVDQCSSYRALLVSSSLGKAFHNVWRRRVMPYVHGQATPLQFTAQRKALVSQASHCARLFMNQAQYYGRSCFLIYLDIQAAYYQLIRQHAVNLTFADQDIYVFLRRMGVDPMHIEELAALLQQPSVLTDSGCPDQLHGVVSEIHDGTWWTLSNDHMVIQTSKGTRPGDGFADVLWSLCFSKYLQRINECLTSLEICRPLQWNGECGFASEQGTHQVDGGAIVWADDAVIAADHEDANKIVPMLQTAAAIVVDELYRLGMTPNMSPGKTEAMLMVRGRHSKNAKRFVHCHLKGQVPIVCTSDQVATIRVVPRYVHLGGVLTHDGRVAQEIKRRLAIAADNLAPYRTKVFRSKAIGLDKRLKIFRSTALPALTYNVGTWPMLSQGEHRKWCGGVLRLYKQVLNGLYTTKEQFHMKRERVLAITGLPDPAMLLSLQRCKQFGHYLQRECDYFWALAGQDQMWLHAVYHDLRQVYSQVEGFTTLPSLTEAGSEQQWQDIWRQQPAKIRGVLRRAEAHHAGQIKLHSDVTEFHAKVFEILAQMGLRHPRQQKHQQPSPHYCYICNRSWDTFRAWAMHAFKSHGRLSKYRRLQQGSRCEACGTTFHTHARLCRHFRTATQCANTLAATQRWVEAGLVTGNAEADRLDFLNAMIPSIQTEGECIPQRNGWTMTLETRKALEMFSGMDWTTELPPNTDSLIHKLTQLPIHYDEIAEIVNAQKLYYERQGQAMVATERLDDVLQYLYDRAQQSSAAGIEQEENLHDGWIRDYKELFWCEEPSRPRPSVRYLYVLHLFSGAKRAGDIHSCVQEISAPPGKVLLPVSLDVVLDSQRGNLLDAANQAFWIRAALSGKIFAVVAGPPCETWSISRWRWLRDGTGPRPVRSTNCIWTTIWGIAILKLRELKQVSTGNRLLHFALVMMVAQAATGGMGFLEHPEEPDPQPEGLPPSIWKLPIVQILRRHSSFSLLHLKQGYYGAKSPKPTVIMVICEKSLRKDVHLCIHRGKTQKKLPPALRMEKTSAGYSTMPLKRYPVALCRAIATAISHGVQFAAPTGFENDGIDEVALHFKDAYEVTQDGGHDGQDFFCTE